MHLRGERMLMLLVLLPWAQKENGVGASHAWLVPRVIVYDSSGDPQGPEARSFVRALRFGGGFTSENDEWNYRMGNTDKYNRQLLKLVREGGFFYTWSWGPVVWSNFDSWIGGLGAKHRSSIPGFGEWWKSLRVGCPTYKHNTPSDYTGGLVIHRKRGFVVQKASTLNYMFWGNMEGVQVFLVNSDTNTRTELNIRDHTELINTGKGFRRSVIPIQQATKENIAGRTYDRIDFVMNCGSNNAKNLPQHNTPHFWVDSGWLFHLADIYFEYAKNA